MNPEPQILNPEPRILNPDLLLARSHDPENTDKRNGDDVRLYQTFRPASPYFFEDI